MRQLLERHWPSGVIVAFLIGMTIFLSEDKLSKIDQTDLELLKSIKENKECIVLVTTRIDRLETTVPFMVKAMEKNTSALEKMSDDVQEIKMILIKSIKDDRDEKRSIKP